MIEIKPSNNKFVEQDLNEFQKELGVSLPSDYIKFLKKYNGGIPEQNVVKLSSEEINSFSVKEFFGVNNEKINDLKSQHDIYIDRIPKGNLPICRVEGGNIGCLNIHNGTINLWDHDSELINEDVMFVNPLLKVAENFSEFLILMKPYEQKDNLEDYEVENIWIDPEFLNELNNDTD